ncbi:hypothetical protein PR202_gb24829 [Eleusine coracana subsp. coracana]|uniref:Gamma-tubulin complex component n=1 Tax=Eleusine coracana subsp. coracana TaxID=191504 RepID=A0AAV5FMM9_ELECO|nr:hypothetical protein PR202_gb24829 [Eleusine coracana subsp. coracana]
MLHELLLALLGFTGDFVLDASPARRRTAPTDAAAGAGGGAEDGNGVVGPDFRLAPDLTFLQPSERSAIERLISLGFYYRELNRFATESRDLSWIHSSVDLSTANADKTRKGNVKKGSVYRRAIANGITEILSVYRSAVLQVEQNLLSDPLPILATVTHGLNKFDVLLPPLYELVMEIEQMISREDNFLTFCTNDATVGFQNCKAAFRGITSTILYIQDDRDGENESPRRDAPDKFMQKLAKDTTLTSWHTGFHVSLDMLPEYIHMRVAESILFAGKAIRVLRNPSSGAKLEESFNQSQHSKGSHRMQSFIGGSSAPKELPNFSNISAEELLPQAEADKIDAMLKELKHSSEFHKRFFESAVDSIRTIAASHLWQLVVVRADLNGHLKALKDYFLLAKGDFFQCFLEESRQLMRLPPRQSTAEADLMIPFQLDVIIWHESSTSQKDLQKPNASEFPSQGKAASELALDGWDSIALEYSVDWPLQLFFTPDVLSKYRKVFQYLIRLKRTQMELEKSWAAVMHKDQADFSDYCKDKKNGSATQLRQQRSKPLWHVREHMAFLIRNLQFYIQVLTRYTTMQANSSFDHSCCEALLFSVLFTFATPTKYSSSTIDRLTIQVDVIESQWNVLQSHVQDSHDFTELVSFHQEYLSALISQSFLDIGSVSRILDSIMKLCLQFCWSIEQYETSPNITEIDHIIEVVA